MATSSTSKATTGNKNSSSSCWKSGSSRFVSVLSTPFVPWNDLEIIIGDYFPEWSLTHRSYIVQHLIRFLELKVLTEEFAKEAPLLDPTPLVALAWQAVLHDSRLYKQTLYTIQEFHGRPKQLLKFSLPPAKDTIDHQHLERLNRTQRLFQSYYQEKMIESLEEADTDLGGLEDTSAITDHFFRCGTNNPTTTMVMERNTPNRMMAVKNKTTGRGRGGRGAAATATMATNATTASKDPLKMSTGKIHDGMGRCSCIGLWPCNTTLFMEVIGDLLFLNDDGGDDEEEKSQGLTVLMDDIEEEKQQLEEEGEDDDDDDEKIDGIFLEPYERPEDVFQTDAEGTDYDSSFTFDFVHTRNYLCRQVSDSHVMEDDGGCVIVGHRW